MNCEGCKKELSKKLIKISTGECVNCDCEKREELEEEGYDIFNPSFTCKHCEVFFWGTPNEYGRCNKCQQIIGSGKFHREQITISYEKITEVAADYVLDSPHRCNGTWLKGFAEGMEFATKEAQNQIDRRK